MKVRQYQRTAVDRIFDAQADFNRVLITMPTGTGKTVTFAKLIEEWFGKRGGRRAVVLAHREELLDQAAEKIGRMVNGLSIGIEAAARRAGPFDDVVVASVQTVGRTGSARLQSISNADLLIIDEAHHACAESYQITMDALGSYTGDCFTVGVTATPKRLDNKALYGNHDAVFEDEVFRYDLRAAISDGYLCDVRGFRIETSVDLSGVKTRGGEYNQGELQRAVDTEERNALALGAWKELASGRKTIVFCTGVDHARHVAELFRADGIAAEHVDGTFDKDLRRAVMGRFRSGETQVLCNVEVLTEGFDEPEVGCILMLRPTQSWGMYCQMVGRGTRPLPGLIEHLETAGADARADAIRNSGKPDCLVIDVVDLTSKHELASVPALLGLPPKLDLQGKKLTEAAAAIDELGARAGAIATRHPRTFDDIARMISEVDLLSAAIVVPESVKRASRFAWVETSPGNFVLECGPNSEGGQRVAKITQNALGHRILTMAAKYRKPEIWVQAERAPLRLSNDLTQSIRDADRIIMRTWANAGAFATRNNRWRTNPASEKQLAVLRRMGIKPELMQNLTAGEANALITQRVNSSGRR